MTPSARIAAVLVGLAGIIVALAATVREIVLAADDSVRAQPAAVLRRLTSDPGWGTAVTAAVAAALAVALIILAVRQFRAADGGPLLIQFEDQHGSARLDVRAMERGMKRHLEVALPGVGVHDVRLRKTGDEWRVTVGADAPALDLRAARERMHSLLSDDLQRTAGMRLQRLDLLVDELHAPREGY